MSTNARARTRQRSASHPRFALRDRRSVDDGKSTLVGRLLHDSKAILADQLESVARTSAERGFGGEPGAIDFALLTDGLRAEREQGITIDVAYRYFSTGRRSFILADCPGHVQYTRNMVTGATTADAVVVLVDARNGVLEQTRRHLAVVQLLRVPHVIVAVNKIDLLGYSRGGVHDGRRRGHDARPRARPARRARHPGVRPRGRQRRRALGEHALVRRPEPARAARGPAVARRARDRARGAADAGAARHPAAGLRWRTTSTTRSGSATTAPSPAASPRAPCASATAVQVFPGGATTTVTGIDAGPARARRGIRPAVGVAPARRRARRRTRRRRRRGRRAAGAATRARCRAVLARRPARCARAPACS